MYARHEQSLRFATSRYFSVADDALSCLATSTEMTSRRDPLFLVTSTVGRRKSGPLWTVKTMAEQEASA